MTRQPGVPAREPGPDFDGFVAAQQTWDRAFAENIAKAPRRPDRPLAIGIVGRGHLEFGHGTPYQLRDLGIADAVFALEEPDPPAPLPTRLGFTVAAEGRRLRIASTKASGAAAAAGVAAGDGIVAVCGRPIASKRDLVAVPRRLPP